MSALIKTAPPPARRVCAGCDQLMEPGAAGAPLCTHCMPDPAGALVRVERRRTAARNVLAAAQCDLLATIAALPDADRARWRAFDRARGATDDEVAHKRAEVTRRLLRADDPRVVALAPAWRADEAAWWAAQAAAAMEQRCDAQAAAIEGWRP